MVQPLEKSKAAPKQEKLKESPEDVADVSEFLEEDEPSVKTDSQLSRADMEAAGLLAVKKTDDEAKTTQDIEDSIKTLTMHIEEGELSPDDLVDITDRIQKLEHSAIKAKHEARLEKAEKSGSALRAYLADLSDRAIVRESNQPAKLVPGKRISIGDDLITVKQELGSGAFGSVFEVIDSLGETKAVKLTTDVLVTDKKPNTAELDYRIREGLIGRIMAEGEIVNKTEQAMVKSGVEVAIAKLKPELKRKKIKDDLDRISEELLVAEDTEQFQEILNQNRNDYPPYLVKDYFRATIGKTRKVHSIPRPFGDQLVESMDKNGNKRIQMALLMQNIAAENKNRQEDEQIDDFHNLETELSEEDKAKVGMGTIFAIRKIHQRGIAMRDIKPANIMVDPLAPGNVKVFDFGLSASEYDKSMITEGGIVGTPTFMAPEAAAGETKNLKAQDIYSLGMTLYEGFHGREGLYLGMDRKKPKERPLAIVSYIVNKGTPFENINFLDNKIKDTTEPFKRELLGLIKEMTEERPESRPDIDQVAKKYHEIYSKYQGDKDVEEIPLDLNGDEDEIELDPEKTIAKPRVA
ncbi:protein kinase [Patescibacteria group bacterium]|nr:protein kinase [Patescibacteria group bacterium]MBU1673116.1 protein kinase [Patescibacteria group bacterium]MBU1963794.1 protein kinase [Patescibacteria group bacterium]